jgi:hypothetical protein
VQQVKAVTALLGVDERGFFLPVQPALGVDPVLKILVGLQALQRPAGLAGQLLGIGFFALHGRQPGQRGFGLGQARLAPGPVARLTLLAAGDQVALALQRHFPQPAAIP